MVKRLLACLMAGLITMIALAGCGSTDGNSPQVTDKPSQLTDWPSQAVEEPSPTPDNTLPGDLDSVTPPVVGDAPAGKVGILFPTKDEGTWEKEAKIIKEELEAAGYTVQLHFAQNDDHSQVMEIEAMVSEKYNLLIVAAVDGSVLSGVMDQAKEAGIAVISYRTLINNTDAVSYYVGFNDYAAGEKQGEYICSMLDLDCNDGPFTLEITSGDQGSSSARQFFDGAVDRLRPYIDEGKLVVKSGQIDFKETAMPEEAKEAAEVRMQCILDSFYSDGSVPDALLCSSDNVASGVIGAIQEHSPDARPVITGFGCKIDNLRYIDQGRQSMSVFYPSFDLAAKAAETAKTVLRGEEVSPVDEDLFDNGYKVVPAVLCDPIVITRDNIFDIMVEQGYFAAEDFQTE